MFFSVYIVPCAIGHAVIKKTTVIEFLLADDATIAPNECLAYFGACM